MVPDSALYLFSVTMGSTLVLRFVCSHLVCLQPVGILKTQSSIRFVRIGPDFMLIYEFFLYKHYGYQSKNLSVGYFIHEFSFVQCHIRRFSSSSLFATPLAPYHTTFLVVASMTTQSGFFLTEISKKYNKFGLKGLTVNYY